MVDQAGTDMPTVGYLGFSDFERIALETVYKLGARRQPGFNRYDAASQRPPTLWLVDADAPGVIEAYRVLTRGRPPMTIFVGEQRPVDAELFLEKPLRWSTALSTIETALALRASMPPPAEPAPQVVSPPAVPASQKVPADAPAVSGSTSDSVPVRGEVTILLPEDMPAPEAVIPALGAQRSPSVETVPVLARVAPPVSVAAPEPVAQAPEAKRERAAEHRPRSAPFEPARVAQRRMSEPVPTKRPGAVNVLVVDDSEFTREFMRRTLSRLDVALHFADSGEAAIGMSVERDYALVFLDVVMSGIDGYQVCKTLKSKRRAGKSPPVVMLTSKGSPFDRVRGTFAGCDAYLVKPVEEARLMQIIAKYLPATVTSPAAGQLPGRPAFR